MKNEQYKLTDTEKNAILFALLKQEIGYKKASDLYDAALEHFSPIKYAVQKARNDIEKR